MAYLIDRLDAIRDTALVAILPHRRRGVRSRLVLRDGSLRETRTRAGTFRKHSGGILGGVCAVPLLWSKPSRRQTSTTQEPPW